MLLMQTVWKRSEISRSVQRYHVSTDFLASRTYTTGWDAGRDLDLGSSGSSADDDETERLHDDV
jgi:hypothetical protein